MEGNGSREKVIELYGSLWKTRESSISNLGKQDGKRSGVKYKKGRKELGKWEVVRDSRCQHEVHQRHVVGRRCL